MTLETDKFARNRQGHPPYRNTIAIYHEDDPTLRMVPLSNPFAFGGSVGRFGENRREDVIKAQILLGNAGFYDLASLGAPTGWPGAELERAIRRYQAANGLEADGVMVPLSAEGVAEDGSGETLNALQGELGDKLAGYAAPTPDEVDAHYEERARRIARGEADPAQPISNIVTAKEDGTADHPLGVKQRAAETPEKLGLSVRLPTSMPPQPGAPASDVDDTTGPPWRDGQQVARGGPTPSLTRPSLQRGPFPQAPSSPGPRQRDPRGTSPMQPELRQTPSAPPPSVGGQRLAPEQEQRIREWQRERPDPRKTLLDRSPPQHETNPARPEGDAPAGQSAAPPRRGRIVIAEDGREIQVPPLGHWVDDLNEEDRNAANALNDAIAIEMAKAGFVDNRGSKQTQMEINIYIQECLKAIREELPGFSVTHVFGGSQDGKEETYRKEEHLSNYDEEGNPVRSGSRRPDFTFEIARSIAMRARGNTADVNAGGSITNREARAETGINDLTQGDRTAVAKKAPKGTHPDDIREEAKKFCRDLAANLRHDFEKAGEFDRPAPAKPAEYLGPASARKAAERRAKGKQ